jgi:hypothetical protein
MIRPRASASSPTASHATSTGPIHNRLPEPKRGCWTSQRKSWVPVAKAASPVSPSASRLNLTPASPEPVTVPCNAVTA